LLQVSQKHFNDVAPLAVQFGLATESVIWRASVEKFSIGASTLSPMKVAAVGGQS
jgi:hypothetical protein